MHFYKTKNCKGFSIIEMLVVVSIMGLLTTVVVANIRSGEKTQRLNIAADTAQSGLREMQNNILSGQPHTTGAAAGDFGFELASGGTSYTTFTELPGKLNRQNLETITFLGGVSVSSLTVGGVAASSLQVRFVPPFGRMEMTAPGTPYIDTRDIVASFNLGVSGTSRIRTVTIDGISGRIQIQ